MWFDEEISDSDGVAVFIISKNVLTVMTMP